MLVACRLAGLSALETHCAGVRACAQCGPRLARLPPRSFCSTETTENRRDVGRADPKTPGLNSGPYWPGGGAAHDAGRSRVSVGRSVQAVSGFAICQRPRGGSRAVIPSPRLSARRCPMTRLCGRSIVGAAKLPHPRRGGRPRPSEGHVDAPKILRQPSTGAANPSGGDRHREPTIIVNTAIVRLSPIVSRRRVCRYVPYSAGLNIFGRPSFARHSMNAAIVNERLSRLDLALLLRRVMIVDALFVVPLVRWICDDIIVYQNERY